MTPKLIKILLPTLVCAPVCMAQRSSVAADMTEYVYPVNRSYNSPSMEYAADGNGYFALDDGGKKISRYDIRTGKLIETVFDVDRVRESQIPDIEGFEVCANGRYILVYRNSEKIYRRSFTAQYYVYETRTRLLRPLSYDFSRQRAALMSSDGRMVAFVAEDNNIYIKKNDYDSQVAVTTDGAVNRVINGVPDWVYEEEFATDCSMAWSPDNLTFSYIRYDESQVPMYTLPVYQGYCDPQNQYAYYPGTYSYKYPVAGAPNSAVSVHVYDIETRKIKDVTLPDSRIEYVPRIAYGASADRLMICTLNRDQNHLEIYCANPRSTVLKSVYTDTSMAWISESAYSDIKYYDDGFVVLSDRSGFTQAYKYTYAGAQAAVLTKGDFDVTEYYGVDAKGSHYYQVAAPSPMDRTVCRVDAKGAVTTISRPAGTTSASFSPDMQLALMRYSDTTTAPLYTVNSNDGKQVRLIDDNAHYASRYASCPRKEFFTMTSDGVTLNGYVLRPAEASASNRCPVIMSQYSGPGSQSVLNRWSIDWEEYFAMHGYVVVCVDGRGTGGRGRAFMDVVYRHLGHYETIDQINAAKYAATLPYVDGSRIGIYGWSYGGYEVLMSASQKGAPYRAAVAVAPVTDWRYYDSIYTERYMLTPGQNEDGYQSSAPINRTSSLVCPLLMMYGTADDNVHPVNTLQYVSKLQLDGQLCDMFVFPNKNHSIYGCNARAVVYARMLQFFNLHLK